MCDKCHLSKDWKTLTFKHDRHTKYKLTGQHAQASCLSCHKKNPYKLQLKTDCLSCHKHEDRHKGGFGAKCASCHVTKQWNKGSFNHNQTKFPLTGGHVKAGCGDCHTGNLYKQKISSLCFECHKSDDVHKNKEGKNCGRCHNSAGWRRKVLFDHDTSSFPLIGLHALVACEECHTSRDLHKVDNRCEDCHVKNDVHRGGLTGRCNQCHNPNGWSTWLFDHDKQTQYALKGAHKKLICKACHNKPVKTKIRLSTLCGSCHTRDDIHGGRYGQQCERCHNLKSFDEVEINRK